ncbi:hypothetical protein K493DRAFT_299530 [Basidiobolus meristosporus CBS 931.73]|uniref:Yeast cell wall synthesis Kre9/Knh1-like N-terminal domain-containing protein n=1 Tax=Basidiobolus meristosporus CBS 931.73 TaxID=1314790 RepID=A0A1Y1YMG6_9FUNG|nr:hypothetical protein K493DRAFT_299530 [Basidiobolus meristosporus CBS 931.73]|eukprot:ORX99191.1 hypothetical protein K493DRAFT_299530 [Basidiobolus meristosporus CBS 931.73]
MRAFIISIFLLFTLLSVAAEISIIHPVEHTEWTRGEEVTIEWKIDEADLAETVTIELREGPKANLALVYEITTDADANFESFDWTVPEDLEAGDKYSIRVISDKGADRYSHYFKIK